MEIKCKGFIIRHPRMSDLKCLHKSINDPLIGKNMWAINYPVSKSWAKKYLAKCIKENNRKDITQEKFIIDIDGKCAGIIFLKYIEKGHKAGIGYWLGKDHRGKGIMTIALNKMTQYWFKKYDLKRIYAFVATFNKSSAKLLELKAI